MSTVFQSARDVEKMYEEKLKMYQSPVPKKEIDTSKLKEI